MHEVASVAKAAKQKHNDNKTTVIMLKKKLSFHKIYPFCIKIISVYHNNFYSQYTRE